MNRSGSAVSDDFEFASFTHDVQSIFEVELRRSLRKAGTNAPVTFTCVIGFKREHRFASVNDSELINEAFEFGDQMRRYKDGTVAGASLLIGADHGLNEFAADDGVETGSGL